MPVTGEPTRTRRGARRPTRAGRRAWTASSASVWTAPRRATCNAGASDFGSTRAAASSTSPYTTTRPLEIRRTDDCGAQVACAHEMCLVTGVLLVKVALARSCTLLHALQAVAGPLARFFQLQHCSDRNLGSCTLLSCTRARPISPPCKNREIGHLARVQEKKANLARVSFAVYGLSPRCGSDNGGLRIMGRPLLRGR